MAENYHITIQPLPNWSLSWINWEVQDTFLIHVLVYLWYQKLITLRHNDCILFSVMWVFVVVALRLLWLFRDCSWGLCDMTPIVWPRHSTGKSNQSLLAGAAAWGRRCSFFLLIGEILFQTYYFLHDSIALISSINTERGDSQGNQTIPNMEESICINTI